MSWRKDFLGWIRAGEKPGRAAFLAGVERSTPHKLANRDAGFKDEWDAAKKEALQRRLAALKQSA
jgi:hypothetical protein